MRNLLTGLRLSAFLTLTTALLAATPAQTINDFGIDHVRHLGSLNPGTQNVLVSPAGTYAGLGLLAQGAKGPTREGLERVLGANSEQIAAAMKQIPLLETGEEPFDGQGIGLMSFAIANPRCELLPGFAQQIKALHTTTLPNADPQDWLNSLFRFSEQVRDRSGKMIVFGVPTATVNSHSDFVLVSSMMFNSQWVNPFDAKLTTDEIFYAPTQETVRAPMMKRIAAKDEARYLENEVVQVLQLPFAVEGGARYAMDVILPKVGYEELVVGDAISSPNIKVWAESAATPSAPIQISLPKFALGTGGELWYNTDITGELSEQGDFAGVSACPKPIVASHQSIELVIGESGAHTATAGTLSNHPETENMIEFNANRPFYFQIRDKSTNIVLLSGVLWNPMAGGC